MQNKLIFEDNFTAKLYIDQVRNAFITAFLGSHINKTKIEAKFKEIKELI